MEIISAQGAEEIERDGEEDVWKSGGGGVGGHGHGKNVQMLISLRKKN